MRAARRSRIPGSALVSSAGGGVLAVANFHWCSRMEIARSSLFHWSKTKFVAVRHRNQQARHVRYPGAGCPPAGELVSGRIAP
jgi:hypothetical protein